MIEQDSNPLIVFDHKGHIRYLNDAAEILLGYADVRKLFQIALDNAPQDFGSRTRRMELQFHQLSFYAINVAYNSEEWLALRLYYRPKGTEETRIDSSRLQETDLNLLLEMSIGIFKMEYDRPLKLLTDRDIPPLLTDQNLLSRLLRQTLESFRESSRVEISLTMALGEYTMIDGKRIPLLRLSVRGDSRDRRADRQIGEMADPIGIIGTLEEKRILLDIPFLQ